MPLCSQRTCGCSIQSSSLAVTGSGTSVDPWMIEQTFASNELPYRNFADQAERDLLMPSPTDGQLVYTRADHRLWVYVFAVGWLVLDEKFNNEPTPSLTNLVVGTGGTNTLQSVRKGRTVYLFGIIILGSSGFSVGADPHVTMAYTNGSSGVTDWGVVRVQDASTGVNYIGGTFLTAGSNSLGWRFHGVGNTSATVPITWAASDRIEYSLTIPI